MECLGCGHNYPHTLSCCPKCKRLSPKRGQRFSDSRLIEFPRRARVQTKAETIETPLPAWRAELNERVRAIKAKRTGQGVESEPLFADSKQHAEMETQEIFSPIKQGEPRPSGHISTAREQRGFAPEARRPAITQPTVGREPQTTARAEQKTNRHIVEAALTRVRRASENASRATLPKIEPARQIPPTPRNSFTVDREATARALEPAQETTTSPLIAPPPVAEPSLHREFEPDFDDGVVSKAVPIEPKPVRQERHFQESVISSPVREIETASSIVPDEIEPVDYLEAEIRKVDKAFSAEFERDSGLPLSTHLAICIIDFVTIAISASPFVALIIISNGSFEANQTRVAAAIAFALVGFFYLALTQWLAGKTFGMMMTNTRIVDSNTLEPVTPSRALLRAASYFIAAAPALLGFLWIGVSRRRRGWHDYLSGTVIASDY